MSIKRVDRGRSHWYTIDGVKADGVTTLIGDGVPKPALVRWAAKSVAEYVANNRDHVRDCFDWMDSEQLVALLKGVPWSERDKAAVRGTDVHALAEKLLHGEEVDVPDHLTGYVESCVRFLDDWQVRPVRSETVVASRRWRYCGTFDFVADVRDGRRIMGDYKTGGIYGEVVLQQAAYRYAEVYLDGETEVPVESLGIEGAWAVQLRQDGYDVFELPSDESAFKAFCHVATVARWAKGSRDLIGPALEPPITTGDAA